MITKLIIRPQVKQKKLTSINWKLDDIVSNLPQFPIQLYIYDRGMYYYIVTDLVTSDKDAKLPSIMDKDKTDKQNMSAALKLVTMIDDCKKFYEEHKSYTPDSIKRAFRDIVHGKALEEVYVEKEEPERLSIGDYIKRFVMPTKKDGTAKIYNCTANIICQLYPSVHFDDVDRRWLMEFEAQLKRMDESESYINMMMRNLRHAFNFAIDEDVTTNYPFKKFKIKQKYKPREKHLFLTMQEFADFRDYPVEPWQQRYKDLVLLSFYLCGVNFADLLTIKGLYRDRFDFSRKKTSVDSTFKVYPEAMEIINKYRGENQLLSFLDSVKSVYTITKQCNEALKKMGYQYIGKDKAGKMRKVHYCPMFPNMTVYTFRRSFSNLLAKIGCPREIINMALSHANLSEYMTTELYIEPDTDKLDEWTRKLLDGLAKIPGRPKEVIDAELKERYNVK